jgi:hypothetical protein
MIDYLTVNLYKNTAALQTDGHVFQLITLVTETVIHASLQTRTDNIHSL